LSYKQFYEEGTVFVWIETIKKILIGVRSDHHLTAIRPSSDRYSTIQRRILHLFRKVDGIVSLL